MKKILLLFCLIANVVLSKAQYDEYMFLRISRDSVEIFSDGVIKKYGVKQTFVLHPEDNILFSYPNQSVVIGNLRTKDRYVIWSEEYTHKYKNISSFVREHKLKSKGITQKEKVVFCIIDTMFVPGLGRGGYLLYKEDDSENDYEDKYKDRIYLPIDKNGVAYILNSMVYEDWEWHYELHKEDGSLFAFPFVLRILEPDEEDY